MTRAEEILNNIDFDMDEEGAKVVMRIRNKRVQRALRCPKFFRRLGMACLKLNDTEKRILSKRRRRQWRRKMKRILRRILMRRAVSMGVRAHNVARVPIVIDDKGSANGPSK